MGMLSNISPIALVTLSILLFEHCTTVTLTRYTQQRKDAPRAVPVIVVFLTECLKLVLAFTLELTHCYGLGSNKRLEQLRAALFDSPRDTLRVSLPAALYTIQNILIFVALGNLEIVSFQVLYQTKLMLTAVLSVVFLGRRLTSRQWLTLVALTVGVIAVELSDADLSQPAATKSGRMRMLMEEGSRILPRPLHGGDAADALRRACDGARDGARGALGMLLPALSVHEPLSGVWSDGVDKAGRMWSLRGCDEATKADASTGGKQIDGAVGHGRQLAAKAKGKGEGKGGGKGGGKAKKARAEAGAPLVSAAEPERVWALGVIAALAAATLSSFAGVYFEALIKGKEVAPPSLWVRNVQLCLFTIPLAGLAIGGKWSTVSELGWTYGLDAPTIVLITLNASGGLLVAAVIKYGDNILKNFTTSCSVILGTLISVVLFDFVLTFQFLWASAVVVTSAYAYATAPADAAAVKPLVDKAYKPLDAAEEEEGDKLSCSTDPSRTPSSEEDRDSRA